MRAALPREERKPDSIRQSMISFLLSLSAGQLLNAVGIFLVLAGVTFGFLMKPKEYRHSNDPSDLMQVEEFKKGNWKSMTKSKTREVFWEYVLIVGLGIELLALAVSIPEDLKLKGRIEELRQKNDALEAKQRRIITPEQHDNFIKILKNSPKSPVKVYVGEEDAETRNYAHQIRTMLDDAGYGLGTTNGLIENQSWSYSLPIGDPSTDLSIDFLFFGTRNEPVTWPGITITPNKKIRGENVDWYPNDVRSVPAIVWDAFEKIGIYPAYDSQTNCLDFKKAGDWGIFIPEKF